MVSVSTRIVDTVKRCFDKHYVNNEPPARIWIAFIKVPLVTSNEERHVRVHSASQLAEACNHSTPSLFQHEMVFEWAVPEDYVTHIVSLQTLMERGLQWDIQYGCKHQPPSTTELRKRIADDLEPCDPWELGMTLGSFARKFGARAPLDWVANQLFNDCAISNFARKYPATTDSDFLRLFNDGIDTALIEWWLSDFDFLQKFGQFEEWQDIMTEMNIWNMTDFWEDWVNVEYDDIHWELALEEMWTKQDEIDALIEEEAVKLGL